MKKNLLISLFTLAVTANFFHAYAQNKSDAKTETKSDYDFVATVNGVPITQGLLNLNIRALTSQGQKDSPAVNCT